MLIKTMQLVVHSEHDTLWNLLLERLQSPERYMPGITEERVLEKNDNVTLREMKLHGILVRERVTVLPDESEIRHELLEHPLFTGSIVNKVVSTARQSPVAPQHLRYDLELNLKGHLLKGVVYGEAELVADLEDEMLKLKSRAEEMQSRA